MMMYCSYLQRMAHMILVEFASSLEKELSTEPEVRTNTGPYAFDVVVMEETTEHPTMHFAVCMPTKSQNEMAWYNGGAELIPVAELTPKWRVASLSGVARVLASLSDSPKPLTEMSMKREMVVGSTREEP